MHQGTKRIATRLLQTATALLLQASAPAIAADDAEAVRLHESPSAERLSDAPWTLARRAAQLRQQHTLQFELQNNTLSPRPALDFQRPSRSQSMPVGQLRMTLSEHSSLSLRPRSGGMLVTYREKF